MTDFYILEDRKPVPVRDPVAWGRWMSTADRHVGHATIGTLSVSTVFLGLDHNYRSSGAPVLFETMIFGFDESDSYQMRGCTWDEAVAMHARACKIAENLVRNADTTLAAFLATLSRT